VDSAAEYEALLSAIIDNLSLASACQLSTTINAVSNQWVSKKSSEVLAELQARVAEAESNIMFSVSEALLPVLSDAGLAKAVSEFSSTLRRLLPEFTRGDIRISAPGNVHDLLSEALVADQVEASLVEAEDLCIVVSNQAVELKADLAAWASSLRRGQVA
jgi:hypothetical protein